MTWTIQNNKLTKEFAFKNFLEALAFVNKIAPLAEDQGHHPDVLIHSYNKVQIMLSTHDANAVTDKDHELAQKIDLL